MFNKIYGHFGKLSNVRWKELLDSDDGLFKRFDASPRILGPTLDNKGRVIGDLMTVELFYFMSHAAEDQKNFFNELKKDNALAAKEFLLTISGSIEKWLEDINLLVRILNYLKKEERSFNQEIFLLERTEQVKLSIVIPDVLKRHLPEIFSSLEKPDLKGIIGEIKKTLNAVSDEENYLEGYLKSLKKSMPFLFGKIVQNL